ncbi:MAG: DUF2231 domain-containing protein [Verrucomicrobiaceae bacterium]|nr:MAG: DUF2231 domain-containing protein [Verrucomicrobiaceae bacterium]
MKPQFIEDRITQQGWMKPAEEALEKTAHASVEHPPRLLKNFLHGTWLGHPLHSAIVHLPLGAFTVATILDIMDAGRRKARYAPGADASVGIGLISATVAATAGLADWSHTEQPARRVGVLHAVFNGTATLCYLASWLLRRREQRSAAMGMGIAGWLALMVGGYIGGRLTYTHQIGVDHAQREGPDEFTAIFPEGELPENEPHRAEINGVGILLVKQRGRIFAIGERCAHMGGPLAEGKLEDGTIRCPWHGSRFRLEDGKVVEGPSAYSQPCFETRVRDGQIEVRFAIKH